MNKRAIALILNKLTKQLKSFISYALNVWDLFPAVDVSSDQYLWAFCSCFIFFFPSSLHLLLTAFMFPRQPSPTGYPNTYQLYTMENTRQTILNDYITSQQMQIPRPDMARGLSPREQPVAIPYAAGARGMALTCWHSHLPWQAGERL